MMTRPTPEEIATAKAEAQARFGRSELLMVEMGAPINACVLAAPFDLDSYAEHSDEQRVDLQTSLRNAAHARIVWPSPEEISTLLDKWPAAAEKVCGQLQRRAGRLVGDPKVMPLDPASPPPGLTSEEAQKLLDKHQGQAVFSAVGPGTLSLVLARPDAEAWLAAKTARAKAAAANKRSVHTGLDFARQAIIWSSQPIDVFLDDKPAHCADIMTAYDELGGDGAEAVSKSV